MHLQEGQSVWGIQDSKPRAKGYEIKPMDVKNRSCFDMAVKV